MHQLDNEKLYKDILVKLNKVGKSQDYLAVKIKSTRRTIWKVGKGYPITFETFFKICHWLNEEPSKYIKKVKNEKKSRIYNRDS